MHVMECLGGSLHIAVMISSDKNANIADLPSVPL